MNKLLTIFLSALFLFLPVSKSLAWTTSQLTLGYAKGELASANISTGDVLISEIAPNVTNETSDEFIELINASDQVLDLTDWSIRDGSNADHELLPFDPPPLVGTASLLLEPNQIALILDKDYAGQYNDDITQAGDEVIVLMSSLGNLGLANSGDSLELFNASQELLDDYAWTSDPGNDISFSRNLDPSGEFTDLQKDNLGLSPGFIRDNQTTNLDPSKIVISELLPDPATGEEFIELHNLSNQEQNLSGLILRDPASAYSLEVSMQADEFIVLYKSETGIQLNNSGDRIELLFAGEVIDETEYSSAKKGQSWSRIAGNFIWTSQVTPGEINLADPEDPKGDPDNDSSSKQDLDEEDYQAFSAIAELLDQSDLMVAVTGVVTTANNLFYKDSLHIADKTGGVLVRLPSDSKDKLAVGDQVKIYGELTEYSKMPRLVADKIIKEKSKVEVPIVSLGLSDIQEENIGQLVKTTGIVTRRSGKSFRIAADSKDDTNEILISVRKNTGITQSAPPKNQKVSVSGIVLRSGEQLVLAPRNLADLADNQLVVAGPVLNHDWILLSALAFATFSVLLRRQIRRDQRWDQSKSY